MMFTLREPAASRITTSDTAATTGPRCGARREHGSRGSGDPGVCREGQPNGGTPPNVRRRTGVLT